MSVLQFMILLVIAGIIGAVAKSLTGFSRGGCILSIIIGFIGALIGNWISQSFGWPDFFSFEIEGRTFRIIYAFLGAVIFTLILGLLTPKKK
ncbi:MAG: GlsB/YeaQ/YmgE family stress response membrane protein [Ignavibacteriaceae bacterium]|nr:GlsB/YeaQ/YmgE family stress response membrane protein [Ignavibacteriaceae bacterium]